MYSSYTHRFMFPCDIPTLALVTFSNQKNKKQNMSIAVPLGERSHLTLTQLTWFSRWIEVFLAE